MSGKGLRGWPRKGLWEGRRCDRKRARPRRGKETGAARQAGGEQSPQAGAVKRAGLAMPTSLRFRDPYCPLAAAGRRPCFRGRLRMVARASRRPRPRSRAPPPPPRTRPLPASGGPGARNRRPRARPCAQDGAWRPGSAGWAVHPTETRKARLEIVVTSPG